MADGDALEVSSSSTQGPEGSNTSDAASSSTTANDASQSDVTPSSSDGSSSKGETKESLLEAVTKALPELKDSEDTLDKGEEPPASDERKSDADAKTGEPELDHDPTEEELAGYAERTKKRIQKLLGERDEARNQVKALTEDAGITRSLKTYLQANDIAKDDFQLTLDLASAMRRGDFKTFLEGIGPYVQLATNALGLTLPGDIQTLVQQGKIAPDAAAQMSRDRYARALAESQSQRMGQVQRVQVDTQQRTQIAQSVEQAVNAWEAQVRQGDPDYALKEATVRDMLWAVVRERGNPQTPEAAVAIAKEAYDRANRVAKTFTPQPKPTNRVPSSINRSVNGQRPEPKSMLEAAMIALERTRQQANV